MPTIPYKTIAGDSVPGVTTVLKNLGWGQDALIFWAWKRGHDFPDEKLYDKQQEYFDAGTLAHALAEATLKETIVPPEFVQQFSKDIQAQAQQAHKNFLHWLKGNKVKVIKLEEHMVSEKYKYGGTPDLIATVNKKVAIVDWKSSKAVYDTYWLQLGAYQKLVSETMGYDPQEVHILRISKDYSGWDHMYRQIAPWMWEGFEACLTLHKIKKGM
jgi:predicted RecB family nuclease